MNDTRPATAPVETVTPIKPSEAIRLGCLVAPIQAIGEYGYGQHACALGALSIGYGDLDDNHAPIATVAMDAIAAIGAPDCPACGSAYEDSIVAHLNDDHRWTRERIADWLEGLGL